VEFRHKPVLLNECITELKIDPNGIYVDGTLGGAGHSEQIAKRLSSNGMLVGIDKDLEAIAAAKKRLAMYSNVKYIHGNHDDIKLILQDLNIQKVDGILLDLGVSSYQLDEHARGFSYIGNAKLDMRMNREQELTAEKVVNEYTEEKLTQIIFDYGEERFAKIIAKNICKDRQKQKIETTEQLVDIIKNSIPKAKQNDGHPAKRTFQAIRIEVNNEINPLKETIKSSIEVLKKNGRLIVITFHSLVKEAMQELEGKCTCPKDLPYCVCHYKSFGRMITKKPIIPTEEEQKENSRSKSAKLRVFEKNEI